MDMQQQEPQTDPMAGMMPPPEEDPQAVDESLPLEAYNLVPDIEATADGKEWLDKQGRAVIDSCKKDEEGRAEFMKRRANQLKLYAGIMDPMEFPTEGARAPHLPILLQAMLSLWCRTCDQVCPSKGDIVHIQVTGPEDEARRVRVEKHMNWQIRSKMPDWASGLAASIMQWLLSGSMFREVSWNPIEECNQVEHLPIDDMVIPFSETDLHPLMPNVSRKTRKRRLAKHVLLKMEEKGFYSGISALYDEKAEGYSGNLPTGNSNYEDSKVKDIATTIDGVKRPEMGYDTKDPDAPRELLSQHKWLEIFGTKELKPVIVTADCLSKKVVSLTLREIDDPTDRQRFELETRETEMAMQPQPPMPGQPPAPPAAPAAVKPCKTKTLHTIVHYRLFPNPEGFYGLGAGYLLENANDLVDGLIGDVMVAGKFENMKMGFISKHAQGQMSGDTKMTPGTFKALDCQPEEMDKAIHEFKFSPPSQTLVHLASLLMDKAESQAANQEILSGEQGGSRETAKSMQIRSSNALAVVNFITRLFLEPLKYEIKLLAHQNSVFLQDTEYFYVTEPSKKTPGENVTSRNEIGRADYLEDYDITFTADARAASKPERISDAMGLLDKITQVPAIMQSDPQRGQMLLYLALTQVFTAMEKPDFIAAMGGPPKPPPPPAPMSQVDENAGFLNEKDHPALPDDNHLEHLAYIDDFKASPHFKAMSSTGKQQLDKHERSHVAFMYQQHQGAMNAIQQGAQGGPPPVGGGPGGAGGIPARPNNGQGAPPPGPGGGGPAIPPAGPVPNGQPGNHPPGAGVP